MARSDRTLDVLLTVDLGVTVSRGTLRIKANEGAKSSNLSFAIGPTREALQPLAEPLKYHSPYKLHWAKVAFDRPTRFVRLSGRLEGPRVAIIDAIVVEAALDAFDRSGLRYIAEQVAPEARPPDPLTPKAVDQIVRGATDAHLSAIESISKKRGYGGRPAFAFVDSGASVVDVLDVPESAVGRPGEVALAGNETEAIQLALIAAGGRCYGLQVDVGDLQGPNGAVIPADHLDWKVVRNVRTVGEWSNENPGRTAWPDRLDNATLFAIANGGVEKVWLTVRTKPDQPPGAYTGVVIVRQGIQTVARAPLHVRVWGFSLPDRPSLKSFMFFAAPVPDILVNHRYMPGGAWSGALIGPKPAKGADGSMGMDFAEFDRVVERYRGRGVNTFAVALHSGAGNHMDELGFGGFDLSAEKGPEQAGNLRRFITLYTDHLRERGWLTDFVYKIGDEPGQGTAKTILARGLAIKEACAELKILLTCSAETGIKFGIDDVIDIYCPQTPHWRFHQDARRVGDDLRRRGKDIWWYTCGDPYPVAGYMPVGHAPVVTRAQFWMNWIYGVPGTLCERGRGH